MISAPLQIDCIRFANTAGSPVRTSITERPAGSGTTRNRSAARRPALQAASKAAALGGLRFQAKNPSTASVSMLGRLSLAIQAAA